MIKMTAAQEKTVSSFQDLISGRLNADPICYHKIQKDDETESVLIRVELENGEMTKRLWVGKNGYLKTELGVKVFNNGTKRPKNGNVKLTDLI